MAHEKGDWKNELGNSVDMVEMMPSPRYIKTHLTLELLPEEIEEVKPKVYTYINRRK
jgi:Sulfotransferase domain.